MREIEPGVWIAGQIEPADIAELAAMGVAAIVNNRPDHEERGQPTSAEIEAAAHAAGITYAYVPIAGGFPADAVATVQIRIGQGHPPVLLFCRSGMRSAALWALARRADGQAADDLIAAAATAGQELSGLRPLLA